MPMQTLAVSRDRDSILRRIARLKPLDARQWGRMSAHEMVCHLSDSYRLTLGKKAVSLATGFVQRTIVKWIALNAPMNWPHDLKTRPEMEQGRGGTPPVDFQRDREDLLSLISRFCVGPLDLSVAHPIFGPLTREEWLRWGYLHADHHLRQFGR